MVHAPLPNPGGTVPTLMHDGNVIDDSREILEYLDEHFPATDLLNRSSERQSEIIDEWISKIYSVPFRELSYGSPRIKRLGALINKKRVRNLRMRREETPELAMEYGAKIMDIEGFSRNARSPVCLKRTPDPDRADALPARRRFEDAEAHCRR